MNHLPLQSPAHSQHFHILIQHPGEALTQLAQQTPLSKQQLKTYAQKGAVWLKTSSKHKPERLRRLKKNLSPGMALDVYYNPQVLDTDPAAPTLIADRQSYSVWLKPRGMLSQGSKWGDHTALYRWVEMHYTPDNERRQAWIVHRLDRATAGLMLLAHSKKMAQTLSGYFEQGLIHKRYQANVWGAFPKQTQTLANPIDGKPAVSHISLIAYNAALNVSRVSVQIETGRKHQIRRHLAECGFPIIGDRLYGSETWDLTLTNTIAANQDTAEQLRPDLQLTAFQLSFLCPLTQLEQTFCLDQTQLDLGEF